MLQLLVDEVPRPYTGALPLDPTEDFRPPLGTSVPHTLKTGPQLAKPAYFPVAISS